MPRAKIRLADNIARVVFIDTDATKGATLGTNLYLPSGVVATPATLLAYMGSGQGGTASSTTQHSQLQGLSGNDHPQYLLGTTFTAFVATLADVAFSGSYYDLLDTPVFADVAFSGSYYDLLDTPTWAVATDPIWNAKGDLAGGTGADTAARLAVGTDGQVLTADAAEATGMKWANPAGGGGGGTIVDQTADLSVTSNAAYQDTTLVVALTAGTWAVEVMYSASVNATPGASAQLSYTGTVTKTAIQRSAARGSTVSADTYTALPAAYSMNNTSEFHVLLTGFVKVSDSGNLKMEFKQNTSSATAIAFREGSWIRVTQIA